MSKKTIKKLNINDIIKEIKTNRTINLYNINACSFLLGNTNADSNLAVAKVETNNTIRV